MEPSTMTTLDTTAGSDPGEMPPHLVRQQPEKKRHWRDCIPLHPACAAFPDLSHDELLALGRDIKTNGLLSPIVIVKQEGQKHSLLDGKNRLAAAELVGIEFELGLGDEGRPFLKMPRGDLKPDDLQTLIVVGPFTDDEANAYAIALNAHRRHLDAEGKRKAIAILLKADPAQSDRQVSDKIGASPTTVGKVRQRLEQKGEVSRADTRRSAKGQVQPAQKARRGRPPKKTTAAAPPTPIAVVPAATSENALDAICAEWSRSQIKQLFLELTADHRDAFCAFINGGAL
jgi:DNA-binding Lrp family transcriptional regulator